MSLEDEIGKQLWNAVGTDAAALEALVRGEPVDVDAMQLLALVLRRQTALDSAVLQLAREIDRLNA